MVVVLAVPGGIAVTKTALRVLPPTIPAEKANFPASPAASFELMESPANTPPPGRTSPVDATFTRVPSGRATNIPSSKKPEVLVNGFTNARVPSGPSAKFAPRLERKLSILLGTAIVLNVPPPGTACPCNATGCRGPAAGPLCRRRKYPESALPPGIGATNATSDSPLIAAKFVKKLIPILKVPGGVTCVGGVKENVPPPGTGAAPPSSAMV